MHKMALAALGLALAACGPTTPAPPRDGPFGIGMGEPLDQLGPVVESPGTGFEMKSPPPLPHSKFTKYYVTATPETGVCKVEAGTPPTLLFLEETFEELKGQLDSKYGKSSKRPSDNLDLLSVEWGTESDSARKENVDKIILSERHWHAPNPSENVGTRYVVVQYFFANFKTCDDVIQKPINDALERERKATAERGKKDAGRL